MIYEKNLLSVFQKAELFGKWENLHEILEKSIKSNPNIQNLTTAGCMSLKGSKEELLFVIAALYSFQKSIILVDDILDNDPRGEHILIGEGQASNLAQVYLGTGFRIINNSIYLGSKCICI